MFSATFEHKLANLSRYRVYDVIQEWIRTEGGKPIESHKPTLVVASTGSLKGIAWEGNARKTMRFELTQLESDVLVKVRVSSSLLKDADVASHGDEARFNWGKILATLWRRLGDTEAIETDPDPPASWTVSLRRGKWMTRLGIIITGVGYLLVLFSPTVTGAVVSSLGLIILVNGIMRVRSSKKSMTLLKKK